LGKPEEVQLLFEVLQHRASGVMFDVGAHSGGTFKDFAKAGWEIHAFEPDPENYKKVAKAAGDNPKIILDRRALSDESRRGVSFYSSDTSAGISTLTPFHESHHPTATVDVTTLAEYCREKGVTAIDFLKIDAEGYDFPILRGVPWDKLKPSTILCEFEDNKTRQLGYGWRDMADFLMSRGYYVMISEWAPIVIYGGNHKWNRFNYYPCELSDPNCWGNILAVRSPLDFTRLMQACKRFERVNSDD